MSENFNRIAEGLKDAAKIAACSHDWSALIFQGDRAFWHCEMCGGRFNRDPRPQPAQGEPR